MAEVACKYKDPCCPCQDGDPCHYEGKDPMTPPTGYTAEELDDDNPYTQWMRNE